MSKHHHLTSAFLRTVLDGRLTREAAVHTLCRTLAAHCDECAQAFRDALQTRDLPPHFEEVTNDPANLDAEIHLQILRNFDLRARVEFLAAQPPVSRDVLEPLVLLVMNEVRNHLADQRETEIARAWIETAFEILRRVDRPVLLALIHAHRGNLERIVGNFREAEEDHQTAAALLGDAAADHPQLAAEILNMRGSLYLDLRQLDQAKQAFSLALDLSRAVEDTTQTAKALILLALSYAHAGDAETAVAFDLEAIRVADFESRLSLIARFNLVHDLLEADRTDEARLHLVDLAPLLPDAWQSRVLWLDGRLAAAEGKYRDAETLLLETRAQFSVEPSQHLDVALIDLDLAALYLKLARWAEIPQLLQSTLEAFQDVPPYIVTAYRLLDRAVHQRDLTAAQIHAVYVSLRDWRDRPRATRLH